MAPTRTHRTRGWYGTDSFSYRAADGEALSGVAMVNITVQKVNRAPTAQSASFQVQKDGSVRIDFDCQVDDPDSDALTLSLTNPAKGSLTRHHDGSYTYKPRSGFTGTDAFSYTVSDGKLSASATITLMSWQFRRDWSFAGIDSLPSCKPRRSPIGGARPTHQPCFAKWNGLMKTLVATLALVLYTAPALLGASCRAQDTQPASYESPEAAVRTLYGAKLLQKWEARGGLNGDGREDWAAEISYQDGDLNSRRLMILVKNEQGAYLVAALSKPDTLPRTFIEEMEIRGLTLHVRESFPGDHPQASEAKVREYRGTWSVVGKAVTTYYSDSDKATTEDTNLLNGARITTYLEGEKVVRTVKSKQPVESTNLIDNTI